MRYAGKTAMVMQMKMLAAIGLSLAAAVTGVVPAEAFPSFQGPQPQVSDDVQQVKQRKWYRKWSGRNHGFTRRYANRGDNDGGSFGRYHRRGGNHGHRYDSHHYKRYYRHHDDDDFNNFGAVLGGLAAGAVLGGLLARPYAPGYRYYSPSYSVPSYYGSNTHVGWCYGHYRSYRADDNTYQPYYGPRRLCVSPYYYDR